MISLTKLATTGALALSLTASSLNVAPANAHDHGAGLAIGLATGLIIGGILLESNRHRHYGPQVYFNSGYNDGYDAYDGGYQQSCYLGPRKVRFVQECSIGRYGERYCYTAKRYYQNQICN